MGSQLFDRDWEFILDTIYRINMTVDVSTFANETLFCLCTLIPCEQGTFFSIKEVDGVPVGSNPYVWGTEARFMSQFMEGRYDRDPYFGLMGMKKHSYAFRDTDMIPEEQRLSSRVFKEIYIPQGIYYALRLELAYHESVIGQFALFNSQERGDFSERDLRIANLLAQHIAWKYSMLNHDPAQDAKLGKRQEMLSDRFLLTQRECEVIGLVADGLTDDEISEHLFISVSTVKKHIYNSCTKIGVNSRAQLIQTVLTIE